jgi:hypothetical protein
MLAARRARAVEQFNGNRSNDQNLWMALGEVT